MLMIWKKLELPSLFKAAAATTPHIPSSGMESKEKGNLLFYSCHLDWILSTVLISLFESLLLLNIEYVHQKLVGGKRGVGSITASVLPYPFIWTMLEIIVIILPPHQSVYILQYKRLFKMPFEGIS